MRGNPLIKVVYLDSAFDQFFMSIMTNSLMNHGYAVDFNR